MNILSIRTVIVTITVATSLLWAQGVSDAVTTFTTSFYEESSHLYRSGNGHATAAILATAGDTDQLPSRAGGSSLTPLANGWRDGGLESYTIAFTLDGAAFDSLRTVRAPQAQLQSRYEPRDQLFTLTLGEGDDHYRIDQFSQEAIQHMSATLIGAELSFVSQQLEFDMMVNEIAAEIPVAQADSFEEVESVSRYGVRFRRLFNGGIIRKNLSFVEVWFTREGRLNEVRIRWPQFTADTFVEIRTVNEALLDLTSVLTESVESDMARVANSAVEGVACSWLPEKGSNGEDRIVPHYAFKVSLPVVDEFSPSETRFIDIPAALP
ncbi:MAG: hypothetical protein OCD01_12545 [Fibrobacterales bacterium]